MQIIQISLWELMESTAYSLAAANILLRWQSVPRIMSWYCKVLYTDLAFSVFLLCCSAWFGFVHRQHKEVLITSTIVWEPWATGHHSQCVLYALLQIQWRRVQVRVVGKPVFVADCVTHGFSVAVVWTMWKCVTEYSCVAVFWTMWQNVYWVFWTPPASTVAVMSSRMLSSQELTSLPKPSQISPTVGPLLKVIL